jgi:hypothetical protein
VLRGRLFAFKGVNHVIQHIALGCEQG